MALIARRSFKYGSRSYSPGDAVPVRPGDRKALTALGWIEHGEEAPKFTAEELMRRASMGYGYKAPEATDEDQEEAAKPKRKYNRRDMKADD